jgi:hypothetical protein
MNTDMTVANTILAQLGGNRFIAMTGAKNLMGDKDSLQFKIGAGAKDRITHVRVLLSADDTYAVTFYRISGRGLDVRTIREDGMVYADSLRATFEAATGFRTSL